MNRFDPVYQPRDSVHINPTARYNPSTSLPRPSIHPPLSWPYMNHLHGYYMPEHTISRPGTNAETLLHADHLGHIRDHRLSQSQETQNRTTATPYRSLKHGVQVQMPMRNYQETSWDESPLNTSAPIRMTISESAEAGTNGHIEANDRAPWCWTGAGMHWESRNHMISSHVRNNCTAELPSHHELPYNHHNEGSNRDGFAMQDTKGLSSQPKSAAMGWPRSTPSMFNRVGSGPRQGRSKIANGQRNNERTKQALLKGKQLHRCCLCCRDFSSWKALKRHETSACKGKFGLNSMSWAKYLCGLLGDVENSYNCLWCDAKDKDLPCTHRIEECWTKPVHRRAFFRRDNCIGHLVKFHKFNNEAAKQIVNSLALEKCMTLSQIMFMQGSRIVNDTTAS